MAKRDNAGQVPLPEECSGPRRVQAWKVAQARWRRGAGGLPPVGFAPSGLLGLSSHCLLRKKLSTHVASGGCDPFTQ